MTNSIFSDIFGFGPSNKVTGYTPADYGKISITTGGSLYTAGAGGLTITTNDTGTASLFKTTSSVKENEDNIVVKLLIPDLKKDSICIDFNDDGNILNVKAEYKDGGKYDYSVYLYYDLTVTGARASYIDGVIQVTLLKAVHQKTSTTITVD